jgi:hypothetical protein
MKYNENHPKEILDKVHRIEKKHITFLKKRLKENTELKDKYIFEKILSGIHRKKNKVATFHPCSDSFLDNIYLRIRHCYYEIIDKYKHNHLSKLNDELEAIKTWLIKSYKRDKYSEPEFARAIDFINKFSIYQATNFIVRDIVYEKMISNPIFSYTAQNSQNRLIKPEPEVIGKAELNGFEVEVSSHDQSTKVQQVLLTDIRSENDMVDAQGAADFTGYKLATIRVKTSKKTIPFHKLPNSSAVRYSKTELSEWMKNGNTPASASLLENLANGIRKKNR